MRKFLILSLLIVFSACATPVDYRSNTNFKYEAVYGMESLGFTDNFIAGYTLGLISPKYYDYYGYADSDSKAIERAREKCENVLTQNRWHGKAECKYKRVARKGYSAPSSGYSTYSSGTNSGSGGFASDTAALFYDKSSGGMRECLHDPGALGECAAFKAYTPGSYDKDTLYYNSETNSMQPCIGVVTVEGKCSAFGIYNYNRHANKNQLFYDKSRNVMTTCSHVSATGECFAYDLVAKPGATRGKTGYRMTNPSNPYHKIPPSTPQESISLGLDMLSGNCTLGLNC